MAEHKPNALLPQQLRDTMRDLNARVHAWWKSDGLGHTSDMRLTNTGGLEVEFSCSLYLAFEERVYDEDSSLPEVERRGRVRQHFEAKGFVLLDDNNQDVAVRDCDASCNALRRLLAATLPSSAIMSIETRATRSSVFVLQSVKILVRDLADVFALPDAPAETW